MKFCNYFSKSQSSNVNMAENEKKTAKIQCKYLISSLNKSLVRCNAVPTGSWGFFRIFGTFLYFRWNKPASHPLRFSDDFEVMLCPSTDQKYCCISDGVDHCFSIICYILAEGALPLIKSHFHTYKYTWCHAPIHLIQFKRFNKQDHFRGSPEN